MHLIRKLNLRGIAGLMQPNENFSKELIKYIMIYFRERNEDSTWKLIFIKRLKEICDLIEMEKFLEKQMMFTEINMITLWLN